MKVLAYGEILWDIIQGKNHLGGAPFNFAAHSAQCGAEAAIVSRLGNDYLGVRAYDQCKHNGVDQRFLQCDSSYPTGTVYVSLQDGQPGYLINKNVAYDFIEFNPVVPLLHGNHFDVFYFGTLVQRSQVSKQTLRVILSEFKFQHVFYDVNLRKNCYSGADIQESIRLATIFKLNIDEVPVISRLIFGDDLGYEAFCEKLSRYFPNIFTIIITASEHGCYIFHLGVFTHVMGLPIRVADAVGAGDAFSASYMRAFFSTSNARFAAEVANRVGAFVASQSGAVPEYPTELQGIFKSLKKVI